MRRIKRKFKRPKSPWDMQRIEAEKRLMQTYGLRRKKELRMAEALLRNFRQRARSLIAMVDEKEKGKLLAKLQKMAILPAGTGLDDVLALTVQDVLNRRLQTMVFKQGKALSIRHARQVIVHEQIIIEGRVVKYPSYLVPANEEGLIQAMQAFERPKPVAPATETAAEAEEEEVANG